MAPALVAQPSRILPELLELLAILARRQRAGARIAQAAGVVAGGAAGAFAELGIAQAKAAEGFVQVAVAARLFFGGLLECFPAGDKVTQLGGRHLQPVEQSWIGIVLLFFQPLQRQVGAAAGIFEIGGVGLIVALGGGTGVLGAFARRTSAGDGSRSRRLALGTGFASRLISARFAAGDALAGFTRRAFFLAGRACLYGRAVALFIAALAGFASGRFLIASLGTRFARALFLGGAGAFVGGGVAAGGVVAGRAARLSGALRTAAAAVAGSAAFGVRLPFAVARRAGLAALRFFGALIGLLGSISAGALRGARAFGVVRRFAGAGGTVLPGAGVFGISGFGIGLLAAIRFILTHRRAAGLGIGLILPTYALVGARFVARLLPRWRLGRRLTARLLLRIALTFRRRGAGALLAGGRSWLTAFRLGSRLISARGLALLSAGLLCSWLVACFRLGAWLLAAGAWLLTACFAAFAGLGLPARLRTGRILPGLLLAAWLLARGLLSGRLLTGGLLARLARLVSVRCVLGIFPGLPALLLLLFLEVF